MSDMLLNINPKFVTWYNSQSTTNQTAIQNEWTTLSTDARVNQGWRSANYAKQTFLIQWCETNLGYAP